tara:strand:- start:107 stop:400 length:294 start_codon:yes stop_codon:yes gene_type:complete
MNMSFFDVLDYLSSKYMLPIGGMLTGIFVLYQWGIPELINELRIGMKNDNFNESTSIISGINIGTVLKILFIISASVIGFILINEIIANITGSPIIG